MFNFLFYLGKIFNLSFKSKISLFIYLNEIVSIMLCLFSSNFISDFIMLEVIIIILVITTVRFSNSMIYSKITKHLSMNILNLDKYYELDYCNEKEKIAEIFKNECIEALLKAKENKITKIRATTHKWMFQNVFSSDDVLKFYDLTYTTGGEENIIMEMSEFIPISKKNTIKNKNFIRNKYKVKLELKKQYR